jgi:hypothetical protein
MCLVTVFILALNMYAFSMPQCFSNIVRAISTRETSFHCDSLLMSNRQLSGPYGLKTGGVADVWKKTTPP